jgi:UDP:flavonoid glycosyltransferase YjiC (YdhE family)
MSRIVLSTVGTHGDFVPFVGLGRALAARGHEVVVAVNPSAAPLFQSAGLATVACGSPYGPEEARSHRALFDEWRGEPTPRELLHRIFDLEGNYHALLDACRGADLLVAVSLQLAAPRVHDALGIPWIAVSLLPGEVGTHGAALRDGLPKPDGLHPLPGGYLFLEYLRAPRILLASSRHFHGDDVADFDGLCTTGFWFHEGEGQASWRPPPDVERFMGEGAPPVVLTFGSLPVDDAPRIVSLHRQAAREAGLRLLVQRGWGNLSLDEAGGGDDVLVTGPLPHDWLFPRSAAVVHHGGIGVTARALRHGCPMLVQPYGRDQFFNAWRVVELGAGVAMHPHELTVRGLSQAFERLQSDAVRGRVAEVAARIGAERGTDRAREGVEACLRTAVPVAPSYNPTTERSLA